MKRIKKTVCTFFIICLVPIFGIQAQERSDEAKAKAQITATGKAVREAFKKGDVQTIAKYHHPDVIKALGYDNVRVGREAVMQGLEETLASFDLEFLDEKSEEAFVYEGDLVIKQMKFALRLIPKNGDTPFIFRGRTLLVLKRYEASPTGWATLHEIIQPYQE
ncbi:MAG: nuclear transport factor 2 family protein [Flavobacteriaceae bacterium]|nr:nuclear transport factor 2 family protein [Flavobacteriaceae bacterium]